ncbi:MAG: aminotransferase class I/II-fold pyridoxal phosphate-dependent enzyme [Gemmatimonadota bacterium]|nr:aminotransferase class I/II-fold pyridoxal phosphate-dependent enzyme [Gemmatimonadota bacterium]
MREIILDSPVGPEITMEGKRYLYFGGTNYLGMAGRPEVIEAARAALDGYGLSSSASRSTSGTSRLHLELETAISAFAGCEATALLCSGYMSMLALLEAVAGENDQVLLQQDAHPSIRMAVRASGLPCLEADPFDPDRFAQALGNAGAKHTRLLVVGEGVSPLTGRLYPLPRVLEQLGGRQSLVLLDEAHAFGVIGETGAGTAEYYKIADERVLCCATLSKAFGASGGIVPGKRELVEALRARSNAYLAASPPPGPVLGAARAAVELVAGNPGLIEVLHSNTTRLKDGIRSLGLDVDRTPVPIVPVWFDKPERMQAIYDRLLELGVLAPYTSYPGCPPGGMIRLAVSAAHTGEQIEFFLDCLKKAV